MIGRDQLRCAREALGRVGQSCELEIVGEQGSVKAGVGEAILIPNGAKVTYRGRAGTVGFFVLWPFDWNTKTDR